MHNQTTLPVVTVSEFDSPQIGACFFADVLYRYVHLVIINETRIVAGNVALESLYN